MGLSFDISKIALALSSAALDPTLWGAALETVSTCTRSFGAAMFPIDGALPFIPVSRSLEFSFDSYVRNGWIYRDERYRGVGKMVRDGVFTDSDFISTDEMKEHPYYQEFLAPCRLQGFAGVKIGTATAVWCLSIQRTFEQGWFTADELGALRELSNNLGSVAATAEALGFARAEVLLTSFEIAEKAVVLLDRKGEVVRLNTMAEKLFGSDIKVMNRRLVSSNPAANEKLISAIKSLVGTATMPSVSPIALPREDRCPVIVYAMRVPTLTDSPFSSYQVVLILADPELRPPPQMPCSTDSIWVD